MKQIHIGVEDPKNSAGNFIEAWKHAQRNRNAEIKPVHRLTFENLESLLKALTPGRWALLKKLRKREPMSILSLSKEMKRDYKNVYTDVKLLEKIGLIHKTEDKKIEVSWDIVEARLRLAA